MRKSPTNGTVELEVMTGLAGQNPAHKAVVGH
jgi:hypothetical protein